MSETERAEKEKAEMERAEKEKAEMERAEKEKAGMEKAENEKAVMERAEKKKAGMEREKTGRVNEEMEAGLEGYFKKGVFLIAMLLLLTATFQLYFSIERVLNVWFEYQYFHIFKAIYNFFVLLVALYVIRLYITNK